MNEEIAEDLAHEAVPHCIPVVIERVKELGPPVHLLREGYLEADICDSLGLDNLYEHCCFAAFMADIDEGCGCHYQLRVPGCAGVPEAEDQALGQFICCLVPGGDLFRVSLWNGASLVSPLGDTVADEHEHVGSYEDGAVTRQVLHSAANPSGTR